MTTTGKLRAAAWTVGKTIRSNMPCILDDIIPINNPGMKPRTYRRRETHAVAQGTSFSAVVLTGTFSLPREHAHLSDAGFHGGLGAGDELLGTSDGIEP